VIANGGSRELVVFGYDDSTATPEDYSDLILPAEGTGATETGWTAPNLSSPVP